MRGTKMGAWPLAVWMIAAALWLSGCASVKTEAPLLLDWKVEASNTYVLAGEESDNSIHIDVHASMPDSLKERIPLNVSLVIDHSGSMSGEQMNDARQALRRMLDTLHKDDTVSVVAFSTRVEILQAQEIWGDVDKLELADKIDALAPRGTTAMSEALGQALGQVRARYDAGRINRIMLLSDGIPNDATPLHGLATNAQSSNIAISTFGLGPYYNEDLMAELADLSGGKYHFIEDSAQIATFFQEELKTMEQIVARNTVIEITLGPGVTVTQTLGGQAQQYGRNLTIFLGDFGVSDNRQIAMRLKVTAQASGSAVEVIDARMGWEDVIHWSGTRERWAYVQASSTRDQALIDQHHDKLLEERIGRLQAAWEMERAIRDFEAGRREEAEKRMRRAAQEYRSQWQEAESHLDMADETIDGELVAPQAAPVSPDSYGSGFYQYMEKVADEMEESEPEEDKGKILIKKTKRSSRKASGK